MTIKILMPALSPTMKEGNLQKWHVKIGDKVSAGDILAEIETDKATMEIEAVDEGKVTNILVREGSEGVAVNTTIAILNGSGNEKIFNEEDNQDNNNKEVKENKDQIKQIDQKKENENDLNFKNNQKTFDDNNLKIIASPYAKKKAREDKIDLTKIVGSGPSGRIIKRDFENITKIEEDLISSSIFESFEPSSIRKIIANRTTETKKTVPHYYLTIESKVNKLLKLRKQINQDNLRKKISINDILVKALAIALSQNPEANVSWFNNRLIKYSSVDVSIAVALEEGLVTPIILNTDKKGLTEISDEIKNLVFKSKEGKLKPEEYTGGTITISNLGMYGIKEFSAIINPPQSMILAVGSIQKKLILENGNVDEVSVLSSTLSVDHRSIDGATAAKFLKDFNDIIENPFNIWLQSNDMKLL